MLTKLMKRAIAPVVVLALLCAGSGQARADVTNVTIDSLGQQSIYSTWLGFVFLHTTNGACPANQVWIDNIFTADVSAQHLVFQQAMAAYLAGKPLTQVAFSFSNGACHMTLIRF